MARHRPWSSIEPLVFLDTANFVKHYHFLRSTPMCCSAEDPYVFEKTLWNGKWPRGEQKIDTLVYSCYYNGLVFFYAYVDSHDWSQFLSKYWHIKLMCIVILDTIGCSVWSWVVLTRLGAFLCLRSLRVHAWRFAVSCLPVGSCYVRMSLGLLRVFQ